MNYVTRFTCEDLVIVSSVSQSKSREHLQFSMRFLGYSIKFKDNIFMKRLLIKERKAVFKEG
jgi:hypothetical protein